MDPRGAAGDLVTAAAAGYAGIKFVEPVSMALYRAEAPEPRANEDAARPGPPYRLAAERAAKALGLDPSEGATERAGKGFHYALAVSWAPLYALLRRRTRLRGPAAALLTGAAMSAVAEETLTPLLGFSAPSRAHPAATHPRGVAAHLAFGAAVGVVSEALWALTGSRPNRRCTATVRP
jgi:hypothetical protein